LACLTAREFLGRLAFWVTSMVVQTIFTPTSKVRFDDVLNGRPGAFDFALKRPNF